MFYFAVSYHCLKHSFFLGGTIQKVKRSTEEGPLYSIAEGSLSFSDYGHFCLLVLEPQAQVVLTPLEGSSGKLFSWSISDETIRDVQNIPTAFGHLIRTTNSDDILAEASVSELLDWLVHGDSFFSKRYVLISILDGTRRRYEEWSDRGGDIAFEISEEKHLTPFLEAAKVIEP